MSGTILVVYDQEPKFPATDQNPQATRVQLGNKWVDCLGGTTTQAELDALLAQVNADRQANQDADEVMRASLKVFFNHENRIRALEGKAAVTRAQFLTAVRALATP
jgi:stress response protein SCP2